MGHIDNLIGRYGMSCEFVKLLDLLRGWLCFYLLIPFARDDQPVGSSLNLLIIHHTVDNY